MDAGNYDEFGNYIGEELSSSESDSESEKDEDGDEAMQDDDAEGVAAGEEHEGELNVLQKMQLALYGTESKSAIEQYEDKVYYPSASEIYGPEVEAMVELEDMQPLEEPIIKRREVKLWQLVEDESPPKLEYDVGFLAHLLSMPQRIRNVSFVGNLHCGKTTFVDFLVGLTHVKYSDGIAPKVKRVPKGADKPPAAKGKSRRRHRLRRRGPGVYRPLSDLRYTDQTLPERTRGIGLRMSPMTFLLQGGKGKSFAVNVMDVPGHVNFEDEVAASLRLSDGAVVFVDALEGVTMATRRCILQCVRERVDMVLVVNKIDRLILELRLPPGDAYIKLRSVIKDVNQVVSECPYVMEEEESGSGGGIGIGMGERKKSLWFSPLRGNVVFASGGFKWSFTIQSFARMYANVYRSFDARRFARRLWGEWYFDRPSGRFARKPIPLSAAQIEAGNTTDGQSRTFVEFILEPLYKLYSLVVGSDAEDVQKMMRRVGMNMSKEEAFLSTDPLLKVVMTRFFGYPHGFVDALVSFVSSPAEGTKKKVRQHYCGQITGELEDCDPSGPLLVYVTKFFPRPDASTFDAFGRVMSGTLKRDQRVKVMGEAYNPEDEEDLSVSKVSKIWLYNSRYRIPFDKAVAGTLVLIEGISKSVSKTATVASFDFPMANIFRPLAFNTVSTMKLSVEPLNPSELSKMVSGLRLVEKSYPLLTVKVEESGEHILLGTGELFLDCVMHDLREMFAKIEIKVSDPVVVFRETIIETSALKCNATTPNNENRVTMIAEPMEKGLSEALEVGKFDLSWDLRQRMTFLGKFDWDILAARNLWAFGPDDRLGPNVFLNETFPNEVDPSRLDSIRSSLVRGFRWATKEGPLIEEPIRGAKFKLVHAVIADDMLDRSPGQIIPTARRAVNSAFLTAKAQILEPVYCVEIECPEDCVSAVHEVLERRRGSVFNSFVKPGTPVSCLFAHVPVIDSFGLETDLRTHTQGQAFCLSVFDNWSVVPGDPLDRSIVLRPLEPAPVQYLAREFLVKTRRRKGLSEDVNIGLFLDEKDRDELESQLGLLM